MKKLIYEAKGKPVLAEVEKPACRPDTVLLKTIYSGISNGTERNMMLAGNYNARGTFPHMQVGYQAVSEVVACGEEISRFEMGDVVATGTYGVHTQFHLAREDNLMARLPENFDLLSGAFLSVASVSYHDARRADVGPHDKALVCGAGPIGQFALQACKLFGAHTTLLNRSEARARVGLELGADEIIFGDEARIAIALDLTNPYSVVIETTGAPELLTTLVGTATTDGVFARRGRGRLALIGGAWDNTYASNAAQRAEISIVHAQHFDQKDLDDVIEHVHQGRIRVRPIIQDVVPAAQIVPIYETLRDNPAQLFGTVIDWT